MIYILYKFDSPLQVWIHLWHSNGDVSKYKWTIVYWDKKPNKQDNNNLLLVSQILRHSRKANMRYEEKM